MDLNKLMQMAIEHQQQQEAQKLQHNAAFELLARTFIRSIPLMQRNSELTESMQEVINESDFDDDNDKELFLEVMGNAKGIIIDMADKMESR